MAGVFFCFVVCAAVFFAAFCLRKRLLTPVKSQPQAEVFFVVEVCREAEGLEQIMRGIHFLEESGAIRMRVVIAARDLSAEGRLRAEMAAERFGALVCDHRMSAAVMREMSKGVISP